MRAGSRHGNAGISQARQESACSYVFICPETRSAVVERVTQYLRPSDRLLYWRSKPDLDEATLAAAGSLVLAATFLSTLRFLAKERPDVLEVPEPLWAKYWPRAVAAALWLRLARSLHAQERPMIVSYGIENLEAASVLSLKRFGVPARLTRLLDPALLLAWRQTSVVIDRAVFGSIASQDNYASANMIRSVISPALVVPEVDPRCPSCAPPSQRAPVVAFVGELSRRKGFDQLLSAWRGVVDSIPTARLIIAGDGVLSSLACDAAASDDSITYLGVIGRADLHRLLSQAQVLVLPSKRITGWREQLGLPILESLSHGCTVVTSDETGLAPFLVNNGHHVIQADYSFAALAEAVSAAIRNPLSPDEVFQSLPTVPGRVRAGMTMRNAAG